MSDGIDKLMTGGVYSGRYVQPDGQTNLFFTDTKGMTHQVIIHDGKQVREVQTVCKWFRTNPNQKVPLQLQVFLNPITGEYPRYLIPQSLQRAIMNMQEDIGITDPDEKSDFEEDFMLHPDNADFWCIPKPTKIGGRLVI